MFAPVYSCSGFIYLSNCLLLTCLQPSIYISVFCFVCTCLFLLWLYISLQLSTPNVHTALYLYICLLPCLHLSIPALAVYISPTVYSQRAYTPLSIYLSSAFIATVYSCSGCIYLSNCQLLTCIQPSIYVSVFCLVCTCLFLLWLYISLQLSTPNVLTALYLYICLLLCLHLSIPALAVYISPTVNS